MLALEQEQIKSDIRCECNMDSTLSPSEAYKYDEDTELPFVNHKPNECKCRNDLRQYIRDGKKIWLCSCCCLFGDEEI